MPSANLALPYLEADQAQKNVTVNEALQALDALVHLTVADRYLAAPPGSPVEGVCHIVALGAGRVERTGEQGRGLAVRELGILHAESWPSRLRCG